MPVNRVAGSVVANHGLTPRSPLDNVRFVHEMPHIAHGGFTV